MTWSNSGAAILRTGNAVIKSAGGEAAQRLKEQCAKQKAFQATRRIRTPVVFEEVEGHGVFSFGMHAVDGHNVLHSREEEIYACTEWMCDWVAGNFSRAKQEDLSPPRFMQKLSDVRSRIKTGPLGPFVWNDQLEVAFKHLMSRFASGGVYLHMGECHGDLTFCNVMVDYRVERAYFLDFLPSFVEAPIVDVVKMRQDLHHRWYEMLGNRPVDAATLARCDALVVERFGKYRDFEWYMPLQALNLLRILPYVRDQKLFGLVTEEMYKCTRSF